MKINKKKVLQIIFLIMLITVCIMIFKFSSQDGNHSTGISKPISIKIAEIIKESSNLRYTKYRKNHKKNCTFFCIYIARDYHNLLNGSYLCW